MDKHMLDILACPLCKGKLHYRESKQEFICRVDALAYAIVDDIPVMIVEKARHIPREELDQL